MTATLISPSQLHAALNDSRLRIIDATVLKADGDLWSILSGKDSFETAHIPGATFAEIRRGCLALDHLSVSANSSQCEVSDR